MGKSSAICPPNMQNMLARLLLCSLSSLAWVSCQKENLTAKAGEEAILLSGGGGALRSVEVFSPSTGQTCSLPSLPINYGRSSHTMDSLLLCQVDPHPQDGRQQVRPHQLADGGGPGADGR